MFIVTTVTVMLATHLFWRTDGRDKPGVICIEDEDLSCRGSICWQQPPTGASMRCLPADSQKYLKGTYGNLHIMRAAGIWVTFIDAVFRPSG
jgi:hypothetical protein